MVTDQVRAEENVRLGIRLREMRRERSLTTRELAKLAEVSASMVSQIETGRTGPSLAVLRRIAQALGVPVVQFLVDERGTADAHDRGPLDKQPLATVVRKSKRKRLSLSQGRIAIELLTPDLDRSIEFVWIIIEPEYRQAEMMSHPGEEVALVLSGEMHFFIGDELHVLDAGDSIAFDSSIPHRIENRGSEPIIEVSAISPPRF